MVFALRSVAAAPWRMLMTVPVVVAPGRADITWIGLEDQFRHGEDATAFRFADRAVGGFDRLDHRAFGFEIGAAFGTREIVFWQADPRFRSGSMTPCALRPMLSAMRAQPKHRHVVDARGETVAFADGVAERFD